MLDLDVELLVGFCIESALQSSSKTSEAECLPLRMKDMHAEYATPDDE
jgi:hypothetical protein